MIPKLSFKYDKKFETLNYLGVASRIKAGFYQKFGFYVLPRIDKNPKTIYFPRPSCELKNDLWKYCDYQRFDKKKLDKILDIVSL